MNQTALYQKETNHLFVPKQGLAPVKFMEYLRDFRKEKNRSIGLNIRNDEEINGLLYFKIKFEHEHVNFNRDCLVYINNAVKLSNLRPKFPMGAKVFSIRKSDGVYTIIGWIPATKEYKLLRNDIRSQKREDLLELYK